MEGRKPSARRGPVYTLETLLQALQFEGVGVCRRLPGGQAWVLTDLISVLTGGLANGHTVLKTLGVFTSWMGYRLGTPRVAAGWETKVSEFEPRWGQEF
jgi:hypothetical protein